MSSPAPVTLEKVPMEMPGKGRVVLIAEDEEPVRMLVREILERSGFTVLEAINGVEALQIWRAHAHEISLLLTDMVMPGGVSGRQLAETILLQKPTLPVIYTSGYSTDLFGGGMNLHEGVNYLPKPYRSTALTEIVSAALHSKGKSAGN
ncbi:MAG: response regulator [Chthoniobacteraceae bacterium]